MEGHRDVSLKSMVSRNPKRLLVVATAAIVAAAAVGAGHLRGGSASAAPEETVAATRGAVVVTVGGVGRIIEARGTQVTVPAAAGSSGSSSGSATTAPVGAVFSRITGHVTKLLIAPGQRVQAGQPIAVLDDGGVSASTADLARVDLASAEFELQQRQRFDPLRGIPPTSAEIASAKTAIDAARERLVRVLSPPRPADVSSARLDVVRAEADLDLLRGGTPAARERALGLARLNLDVAEARQVKLLSPPDPADVSAATADVARAAADLAVLERPNLTPAPEALVAAQQAVNEARASLATALRTGDAQEVQDALSGLDQALTEFNALLKPGPGALPAQIDAAQKAIDAAQKKLDKVMALPNPADAQAAQLDVDKAKAELSLLEAGPSAAALAAAKQAVTTAHVKLAQLLGPALRADVTAARIDVRKAQADLAALMARATPASAADIDLSRLKVATAGTRLADALAARERLTLHAPWSGTVTSVLSVAGAPIDASTPLATIVDLDHLAVSVDLSEFDAARVKAGQQAVVKVDALGGKGFPGTVQFIALTGTDSSGVVTFPVRVGLRRSAGLKPGMNVSVRIVVASRHHVVRLPLEAVTRDGEDAVVSVLDASGKPVERDVEVGISNNTVIEIVKGLAAGARVVLPQTEEGGGGEEP